MERNAISLNLANTVSIAIMAFAGAAALNFAGSFFGAKAKAKAAS